MEKDLIQEKMFILLERLRLAWNEDTSLDPKHWSYDNPALGHCAVSALIVQDEFGGDLLRAEYPGGSHYWNRLPDDREVDMTIDQFQREWGGRPSFSNKEIRTREYVLSYPATLERYQKLRKRVKPLD